MFLPPVQAKAQQQSFDAMLKSCKSCHEEGTSLSPGAPRLNGQSAPYIIRRLKQLADPGGNTPHARQMEWVRTIDPSITAKLAAYFASQAPDRRSGLGRDADSAGQIYRHGAEPAIPACATCHGVDGQGGGDTPRLAGQRRAYLLQQLQAFTDLSRRGAPMNRHVWDMTPEQMRQVADFLSGE